MEVIRDYAEAVITSPARLALLGALFAVLVVGHFLHRAYLSPLSAYPGPLLWALTPLPYAYYSIRGLLIYKITELHEEYGTVVRVGPRSLSYSTGDAWNDVYGRNGSRQLVKDPKSGPPPPNGVWGLAFTQSDEDHSRMRRNLSHGFSEKALRDQEPLLNKYVDMMIERLRARLGQKVNINEWLDFTMVDIIGDLTFGESFHCLDTSRSHDWMENIFKFLKAFVIAGQITRYEPFGTIIFWLSKHMKSFKEKEDFHRGFINDKLGKRLDMKVDKTDFMTYVQKHTGTSTGMSLEELQETCSALILGGSETTASLLAGVVYHLLTNPEKLVKLKEEIRGAFEKESDITLITVNTLKYEHAVLDEGMRVLPPLPLQISRVTAPEGNTIAGRFVPGSTLVGVNHYATYHSAANFRDPYDFVPERWLGDERYANDQRKAFQPFAVGPRNCIGQNLAHAEMRVVLARLIWNFNLELCEESKDWAPNLKCWAVYDRGPLTVKLSAAKRNTA